MGRQLDGIPAKPLYQFGIRLGQQMDDQARARADEAVEHHEERMHVPQRDMSPLTALPFAGETISDPEMARLVELVSREGYSLASAADAISRPLALVERELARYYARHRRFCEEWSIP